MKYAIVTTTTGVQHSVSQVHNARRPVYDDKGRELIWTLCGRSVRGTMGIVDDLEVIRCRRCKGRAARAAFIPKRAKG